MKTILYLLLAMPGFCFAQKENSSIPKPAADDCPSWNKKSKSSSKAEYFQYLRSPRSIKNQQLTAIYYPAAQRVAPGTQDQRTTDQSSFLIPRKERRIVQTLPAKENTTTILKEEKIEEPKQEDIIKPKEEPAIASTNNENKNTLLPSSTDSEKAFSRGENNPKTIIKDKPKTESKFKKWFNHTSTKKTKVCKSGDAGKCPSF